MKSPESSPSKEPSGGGGESGSQSPLSPRERVRGSEESHSTPTSEEPNLNSDDLDSDTPDCYLEPPSPEVQAAFDHEMRIETGGYPEGEVPDEPPTPPPSAYATFEADLKRVREAAARDGVPVLPNPLADRFKRPTICGP